MPRHAEKLTKTELDRMRRRAEEDSTYAKSRADGAQRGLVAQARAGTVRFWFRYRTPSGRRKMLAVDEYGAGITLDEAREIAGELRGQVARGRDPGELRERERARGVTVRDAVDDYLEDLERRARSGARRGRLSGVDSQRRLLTRHVLPRLGRKRVVDVTVEDARRLHRALADKAPTADHVRSALHAVLERQRREGMIPSNPVGAVTPFRRPSKRRRALTLEDLARLGEVLRRVEAGEKVGDQQIAPEVALALRVLALTGMRRSELIGHGTKGRRGPREGLRWGDVDLEAATYRLEAHGGGSGGKGGGPRTLPLGRAAVEYLQAIRPATAGSESPIVPSPRRPAAPLVGLDRARRAIFAEAGIEGDAHALRHTFETVAYGIAPALAGALTGRALVRDSVLATYVHVDDAALRQVADRVAARIADALDGRLVGAVLPHPAAGGLRSGQK